MTPTPVTPRVAPVTSIATGGTAVTAFSGPCNGFMLKAAANALYWRLTGTASTTEGGGTLALAAGASLMWTEPLANGVSLSVNGNTPGAFDCIVW
jgi:hypothetical protein